MNCKEGSTGKIVYDLYAKLNQEGHEAIICYGRGFRVKEKNIFKFSSTLEVYFHALMTRITGLTGCFSFFATRKLIKLIKEFNPDVVHVHELHAYFVNILPVIRHLKENNIRTIWTFHCEFMYTGKCGHSYDCNRWMTECHDCPSLREYPSSLCFDFTRKMYKDKRKAFENFSNLTIVAPSKWLADRIKKSFLGDKKIVVVHNGIDTENIFYPREVDCLKKKYGISEEKVVLAVAPKLMSERKGGSYVLDLARRMKDEKMVFILVGVDDLRIQNNDNIIALKQIENQHELAEYYCMADTFVTCSVRETFGLTSIEALCCGTPVCGFKAGGNVGLMPKQFGELVDYGDIRSLVDKVQEKISGDISRTACSEYGRKKYSAYVMYSKYIKLYTGIEVNDYQA